MPGLEKYGCRGLMIVAASVSTFGPAFAASYTQAIKPYNAALARLCPQRHLENMTPGDFNGVIEAFLDGKAAAERQQWERAAQPICAQSAAGLSCANIAYVRAAAKLGKTDQLAKAACQDAASTKLK